MSSAAAQDVLLDKQAPASDKRHWTRTGVTDTRQDCHAAVTISLHARRSCPVLHCERICERNAVQRSWWRGTLRDGRDGWLAVTCTFGTHSGV
jgi:hypothetical protein